MSLARTTVRAGGFCVIDIMGSQFVLVSLLPGLVGPLGHTYEKPLSLYSSDESSETLARELRWSLYRQVCKQSSPKASAPSVIGSQAGRMERNEEGSHLPSSPQPLLFHQSKCWRKSIKNLHSQYCLSSTDCLKYVMCIIKNIVSPKGRWVQSQHFILIFWHVIMVVRGHLLGTSRHGCSDAMEFFNEGR